MWLRVGTFTWAMVLLCAGCGPQVRTIDLQGARDAAVFLVHLNSDDAPTAVDGPYLVDGNGVLEALPSMPIQGLDRRTQPVVLSLPQLESETAQNDLSPRQRVQFRSDARCLQDGSCALDLVALPGPEEYRLLRQLGESIGFLETAVAAEFLVPPTDPKSSWLGQLTLRIPFDLELVASERLRSFGELEAWVTELGATDGIRDFVPLAGGSVVFAWNEQLCLVTETMTMAEICAPGPKTLDRPAFGVVGRGGRFDEVEQDYVNGSAVDRIVVSVNSVVSRVARVDIVQDNFGPITEVHTSSVAYETIAVSPDGILMIAIAYEEEDPEGYLHSVEFKIGQPPLVLEVEHNESEGGRNDLVDNPELSATNDPRRPFVAGTENAVHRRYLDSGLGSPWETTEFLGEFGNFKAKAVAGHTGSDGRFQMWSAHNNGMLFRFTENDAFTEAHPLDMVMPNAYVQECEDIAGLKDNETVSDFEDLVVRGPHDAFAVLESCAVLVWLDPDPGDDPERSAAAVFATDELFERWPMIGTRASQPRIKLQGDEVWIGGGTVMRRALRPAL